MRDWVKHKYHDTDIGARMLLPFVRARDWLRDGWRSDKSAIERQYLQTFGVPLNWANPRTLNEKLNWMKLHVRDPLQKIAADKYWVRAHVQERLGENCLIPLLGKFERAQDICFAELPTSFVLKTNHGSGQNWIVRDKAQVDERRVRRRFREWMAVSHYSTSREWPYQNMKPVIVAEKLLLDSAGNIPSDFKFHCFGGKVAVIQVDIDRETAHRRNFYDLNWSHQPFLWTEWAGEQPLWPSGRAVERPAALPEMIHMAEILSADFPYARIDLFDCGGKIYFGEITFYHGGGFERFSPPEMDRTLGDLLILPNFHPKA